MYNITGLQESETVIDIFVFANNSVNGILMLLFMFSIFFVMLIVLKKWDFRDSLVVTSLICFVLSSFLVYANLLNFLVCALFLIMTALGGLFLWISKP